MSNTDPEQANRYLLTLILFQIVCFGIAATIYDFKIAAVYFGTITIGATAFRVITNKLRAQDQVIRELRAKLKEIANGHD